MRGRLFTINDLRKVISERLEAVIRLLSVFQVLLPSLPAHVRTTASILIVRKITGSQFRLSNPSHDQTDPRELERRQQTRRDDRLDARLTFQPSVV
jgi:hypothetical protein